jgi:drug/metabolite transporter (DMT)-like permease
MLSDAQFCATGMPPRFPPLAVLGALINAFVWGVSWLPLRWLDGHGVPALWVTCIIFIFCAAFVAALRPGCVGAFLRAPHLLWLAMAAGLTNVLFNIALVTGDVVRAFLLFYLMPVWVVFMARALLGERISLAACLRVGIALIGAALVLGQGAMVLPLPQSAGDWLAVGGGAMFGLNNVLLRKFSSDAEETRAFAIFAGGALLPLAAIGLAPVVGKGFALPAAQFSVWMVLAAFALAVLAANLALQFAAPRLAANALSVIMISEVLFAAVSAVLLGDALLTRYTLIGGGLIVSASLLAIFGGKREG